MFLAYLTALVISLVGLVIVDWKYKLAFFANPNRATRTLVISLCFFVVWDVLGIIGKIFYAGNSSFVTNIFLGPEFPLEEIFFLLLLGYLTLLLWRGLPKL